MKPRASSGLPNETWSSDHIALMAEFAYRPQVPFLPSHPLMKVRCYPSCLPHVSNNASWTDFCLRYTLSDSHATMIASHTP